MEMPLKRHAKTLFSLSVCISVFNQAERLNHCSEMKNPIRPRATRFVLADVTDAKFPSGLSELIRNPCFKTPLFLKGINITRWIRMVGIEQYFSILTWADSGECRKFRRVLFSTRLTHNLELQRVCIQIGCVSEWPYAYVPPHVLQSGTEQ